MILLGDPAFYGPRGFIAGRRVRPAQPVRRDRGGGLRDREEDFRVAVLGDPAPVLDGEVLWDPAFYEAG